MAGGRAADLGNRGKERGGVFVDEAVRVGREEARVERFGRIRGGLEALPGFAAARTPMMPHTKMRSMSANPFGVRGSAVLTATEHCRAHADPAIGPTGMFSTSSHFGLARGVTYSPTRGRAWHSGSRRDGPATSY